MSPIPAGPYLPSSGLVAVGWLGAVDGLTPAMVATSLPRDFSTWADLGFVQVTIIPSSAGVDSGDARHAYAQIDAWAATVDAAGALSVKKPIMKAFRLAELIMRGMEDDAQRTRFGKPVALPANYVPARVLSAWPLTEPSEIPDDPSGYARVTFDIVLDWARI